jgi:hypothetical protein
MNKLIVAVVIILAAGSAGAQQQDDSENTEASQSSPPDAATTPDVVAPATSGSGAGGVARGAPAPAKAPASSAVSLGSGGGGGGAGAVPSAAAAAPADDPNAWSVNRDEGPDTAARHSQSVVGEVPGPHPEYNSVVRGQSCYHAAKIFELWQLWHCRRMNRVADDSNGCSNVLASEQKKILVVQAKNCAAMNLNTTLGANGGEDSNCDQIVQNYRDNLPYADLAMFFKGRYMNRCQPAYSVGADPWKALTACPAGSPPGSECSPPLPAE